MRRGWEGLKSENTENFRDSLSSEGRAFVFLCLMILLSYFGGHLKAVCPFFLHLAQVRLDIQKGTDGGRFLDLSGQDVSECPVE